VLAHFDSLGFDLSILVTRWFIPLFATALPFSALFRFYDYLFVVGLSALFRLSVALLSQFRQLVLASDLVQLSGLIHTLGTERLKREKDVQTLFRILRQLTDVTPG
jgi:singapore isolate B (sub-type 7) whole genome shotgun sequence assembly, scaffold_2